MKKGHIFMVAGALSAVFGAAVAGEDDAAALLLKKTVASKAYVDNAFQAKTAANQSGKALVMNSNTAGDIGYLAIDSSIDPGSPSGNLVTNAAIQTYAEDYIEGLMVSDDHGHIAQFEDGILSLSQFDFPRYQLNNAMFKSTDGVANMLSLSNKDNWYPSVGLMVEYVEARSPNIPAPTGDCLNTANHCALVTTYDGTSVSYSWTVMAK